MFTTGHSLHSFPLPEAARRLSDAERFFTATLAGRSYVRTYVLHSDEEIESSTFFCHARRASDRYTHTHACHYLERLPLHYSVTICTLLGEKFLQTTRRPERCGAPGQNGEEENERANGGGKRERERGGEGRKGRGAGAIIGERKGEKGTTERQEWPRTMRNTVIAK